MRFKRKKPPPSRRKTKKDYLEDFYSVLALNHYNSNQKVNIFIELEALIALITQHILTHYVERRDFMSKRCQELLSIFDTSRADELISWRKDGHSTVTLVRSPVQAFICLGRSTLFDTRQGRSKLKHGLFARSTQTDSRFHPGNFQYFIWWDTTNAIGYFLRPARKTHNFDVDHEVLGEIKATIIMCPIRTLEDPKIISWVQEQTGFSYVVDSCITVDNSITIGTYLELPKADLFCRFLITQKAAEFRKLFLQILNPILCENAIWNLAFNNNAQAREKTVSQYLVHIIGFSYFQDTSVKETFLQMRDQSINDLLLARYLRQRIGQVKIDTVMQAVNAFIWFYRRFLKVKKIPFHSQTFAEITNLRKRLREEPEGSDPINWAQMQNFLKAIKSFNWNKFNADDIFDTALISLWGALRISESCDLSHETTFYCSNEDLLKVENWDAKSGKANKPQWKFVSAFPTRPEFCPIQAFLRLASKSDSGTLVRNSAGKPLTPGRLSPMFNKFVAHCKKTRLLDETGKFTWHIFRVSQMNISLDEFDIPIQYIQSTGCHRSVQSTHGYVKRTQNKRSRTAAKLFANKAEQYFDDIEFDFSDKEALLKALTEAPEE